MRKVLFILAVLIPFVSISAQEPDYSAIESAIQSSDYKQAVKIIDSFLADTTMDFPIVRELSLQKARCLKKLFNYNKAAETLAGVLEMNDLEVMAELADCHAQAGRNAEALMLYSQLSAMKPDNLYYKVQKAAMEFKSGEFSRCISTGRQISLTDTIPTIYTLMREVSTSSAKGIPRWHITGKCWR